MNWLKRLWEKYWYSEFLWTRYVCIKREKQNSTTGEKIVQTVLSVLSFAVIVGILVLVFSHGFYKR